MKRYFIILGTIIIAFNLKAQNDLHKLKLYIDCSQSDCDFDFIRTQIPVVNYVRDRKESDIHVLIIQQPAGNGGKKFNVLFLGQNQYAAKQDTLQFFTSATATPDNKRQQLVKVIQAGITPYLAQIGQLDKINISYNADTLSHDQNKITKDKWNNWVFSIGVRGRFSGDKNYKEKNLSANISAARVTEKSKFQFHVFKRTVKNSYSITDSAEKIWLRTIDNYFEVEQEFVKSISSKWSWAVETAFKKSSYDNLKSAISTAAGIEYNIFSYTSSSTKFLALRYMIEVTKRNYLEETVYDKMSETLFSNNLGAYIYFTQPWGSISSSVTWYNYFHDFSKNNLSIDANVALQLIKGVSINFFGNASLIKDQLSLVKAGASSQDVLLRLKALSTNFNYYTGVGINYRFGSKFNNYVNPRFTNGRY